ncbi:uncharacterized protein knockout isoform X2 [Halyomorpha halys]|nr:uncharacterized protein LOC106687111 isoform X2 [Halyomorpha halys]XP_024214892.1 uncharacterized protein LOC106687111 isoform X2 [Halyomorpha halys]
MGTKVNQCLSLLEDCLALQLQRVGGPPSSVRDDQYWMYDSGYLLFQGFLEANLKCFWDPGLTSAVRGLQFKGYVCPGVLLVGGSPPALHLLRAAWSRNVLKPPPNYLIKLLGDVEDCTVSKVHQTGFTPLPDAVCWVILQLGAASQNAVLDSIQSSLTSAFPEMEQPSRHILYDTLADLMSANKIYQTAQGYFVSNPENGRGSGDSNSRQVLLTHAEAAAIASGEIVTIREGAKTHQAIQTNLADVICGGNKSDKILYARAPARTPGRKLERRHSMRLLGSSRRLSSLHRAGSVRLLHNSHNSTENNQKKCSLFSKLFKWSKRQPQSPSGISSTISMPFPPQEWFNSTVLGLHSVGTQTKTISRGDGEWSECGSVRSRRRSLSTSRLPRRQTRPPSVSPSRPSTSSTPTSSKTALATTPKAMSSTSSGYNSLPRSHKSKCKTPQANNPSTRHSGNTIKVELSATPTSVTADTKVDTRMSASINDPSATMTTTINGHNSTKIYVQQQNSPIRSVITFEKSKKPVKLNEKIKEEPDRNDRSSKTESKRSRRPSSLYQQRDKESAKENSNKNKVNLGQLENNVKMKFPSTETIQMEEKVLVSGNKNNKNLCQKKNVFEASNMSLKAGSLIDVAEFTAADERMNNVRKASASLTPLQPALSNDKVLESLSYINVLKETQDSLSKNEEKNFCNNSNNKLSVTIEKTIDVTGKKTEPTICSFPSLSNLSLHFTSIAAQNILNGVSINSLDTLVEGNEKHSLKDIGIHSDLGVV